MSRVGSYAGAFLVIAATSMMFASPAASRNGNDCLRLRIEALGPVTWWNKQAEAKAGAISAWEQAAAAKVPPAYRQWRHARGQQLKSIMLNKSQIRYQATGTPCRAH